MEKQIIKAAELILSYRKFNKYVGNNFAYEPSEIIEVLKETLKEKELLEEYEECALILQVINKMK
jgi:protein-arginine kinase activator protein McsA